MGAKPPRLATDYEAMSYTENACTKVCKYSYFVLMFVLVVATVLAFVGGHCLLLGRLVALTPGRWHG